MYSNNKLVLELLALLKAYSIKKIVVSPGSRHYTLVRSMELDDYFQLYSVVDERSAAFFALGLIQESNEIVAITCTSGTASVNYGSAVSEAYYQKLPLLVLTADNPPEMLNQLADQMIKQDKLFDGSLKFQCQLKEIFTDDDLLYCNRLLNEGLVKLKEFGKGPVHINFPIRDYRNDDFKVPTLPVARKIDYFNSSVSLNSIKEMLLHKKVIVVLGQSIDSSDEFFSVFNDFCEIFDVAVLTDNLSNFYNSSTIRNSLVTLRLITDENLEFFTPEVVITLGGNVVFNHELHAFLRRCTGKFEHWYVSKDGSYVDPFKHLVKVFAMDEKKFFTQIIDCEIKESFHSFSNYWKEFSQSIPEPEVDFSQLYAIGELLKRIPQNSVLQLANSYSVRVAQLYSVDHSVKCFSNRGVNGIDGCMSTAVGYSAATSKIVYLVIGDLAFFYDINSLLIRHLGDNLRILLVNNSGGGVLYATIAPTRTSTNYCSPHIANSAKFWAESNHLDYYSVNSKDNYEELIRKFTSTEKDVRSMLLEVFTDKDIDAKVYNNYFSDLIASHNNLNFSKKIVSAVSRFFK